MTIVRARSGLAADAAHGNMLLLAGELGYETDTGRFKIGNGNDRWLDLPYFVDSEDIEDLVNSVIAGSPGAAEDLWDHIHAPTPHPAYDDGPSFVLLYENAKVGS